VQVGVVAWEIQALLSYSMLDKAVIQVLEAPRLDWPAWMLTYHHRES
jgi:flavorubredoxin